MFGALEDGDLREIRVKEGQEVKEGELMFKLEPGPYQARLDTASADVKMAQLELDKVKRLFENKAATENEVRISEAKLAKAEAREKLAKADLDYTDFKAPFDGVIGHLNREQLGPVREGETLTTLSDNSEMWVYFKLPEKRYLEYLADQARNRPKPAVELVLADGRKFPQAGKIGAIEAKDAKETGTRLPSGLPEPGRRAGPRPDRHDPYGRVEDDAIVVPRRATSKSRASGMSTS